MIIIIFWLQSLKSLKNLMIMNFSSDSTNVIPSSWRLGFKQPSKLKKKKKLKSLKLWENLVTFTYNVSGGEEEEKEATAQNGTLPSPLQ